jgi:Carboxylesterase family
MAAKLLPLVLRVAIVGLLAVTQVGAAVQVTVEQGVLLGTKAKTHDGNAFYAFKGVPFAAPPVEKLRFKVCFN